MSLQNSEAIDWYLRDTLRINTACDPAKDRTLYHRAEPAPVRVNNFPDSFTVLFPHDAHMPKLITVNAPEQVKKW